MTRSFVIDRIFRGVGRIKQASGTTHAKTFGRINEMLTVLFERGRLDLLQGLKDGLYTPMQLYHAYSTSSLDRLPTADDVLNLHDTMLSWAESYNCSKRHRESLIQAVRYLAPKGSKHSVGSLLKRLEAFKGEMELSGQGATFNRTRSAAQSFARDTRKKHSPLWRDIAGVERLPEVSTREGHPLQPKEFVELWLSLPESYKTDVWQLAHTGMRPAEYWGNWSEGSDRVIVRSAKQRVRSGKPPVFRAVPRIVSVPLQAPTVTHKALGKMFAELTDGLIEPYDLRRTFANWMEAAGISRTRRKAYMGHGKSDVTDGYEWHSVAPHLDADAQLLRNYLVSAIVGPCYAQGILTEATPKISGVTRFATPSIYAPSRNRTENLLIKSQLL